jgi:hypothetical protein
LTTPIDDLQATMTSLENSMTNLAYVNDRLETMSESVARSLMTYENKLSNTLSADLDQGRWK